MKSAYRIRRPEEGETARYHRELDAILKRARKLLRETADFPF